MSEEVRTAIYDDGEYTVFHVTDRTETMLAFEFEDADGNHKSESVALPDVYHTVISDKVNGWSGHSLDISETLEIAMTKIEQRRLAGNRIREAAKRFPA